ncbi:MAG: uroporphyrinogen-III C-methyltransferase [Peptococcaceae bacterium]|nr:uroporphyrinogen-III C-methyltransferase [Peptococcaceae bacterium]
MVKGVVYLVGAGPGDPKLITVKGLECIQKSDVIIYDRLVDKKILSFAGPGTELIYAGKSPGCHTLGQMDINRLLIEKALNGKIITRLKGGDPFLFGRGGEEAESLAEAGVPFEIVPGVTSAIAAAAYAGIPVTHRDYTSTLAMITGNEDPLKGDPSIDWPKISTGAGTLVFLMGMANLPHITKQLIENGRSPQTPAAVVRWGTTPKQRTLIGTLADISEQAVNAGLTNPALIIIGEVVSLREKLNWYENRPLFGRRILVTRAREQASILSAALEAQGAEALEFPTISLAEPRDFAPLDRAINSLSRYKWVIFTSVNGVYSFFRRLRFLHKDPRELYGAILCAIGPKTKEAMEGYGLVVDYVPGEFRAEEIIKVLQDKVKKGDRVLLPRADIARKILPDTLTELGAVVDEVTAYRTVTGEGQGSKVVEMLEEGKINVITFTSSSTVRNFITMLNVPNVNTLLTGVAVACIGPITAGTARDMGVKVDLVAEEYTIEGLVKVILQYFTKQ